MKMRLFIWGIIFFAMACNSQTPSSPVEVVAPKSVVTRINENDSTFFSIKVLGNSFDVKLHDKTANCKNGKELDAFIEKNKSLIDPNKIKVIADRNTPYPKFKSVIDALKKHEYYKFSMITNNEVP